MTMDQHQLAGTARVIGVRMIQASAQGYVQDVDPVTVRMNRNDARALGVLLVETGARLEAELETPRPADAQTEIIRVSAASTCTSTHPSAVPTVRCALPADHATEHGRGYLRWQDSSTEPDTAVLQAPALCRAPYPADPTILCGRAPGHPGEHRITRPSRGVVSWN